MSDVSKGWMKVEKGFINIGLGHGKALDIFNKGIVIFVKL